MQVSMSYQVRINTSPMTTLHTVELNKQIYPDLRRNKSQNEKKAKKAHEDKHVGNSKWPENTGTSEILDERMKNRRLPH